MAAAERVGTSLGKTWVAGLLPAGTLLDERALEIKARSTEFECKEPWKGPPRKAHASAAFLKAGKRRATEPERMR